MAVEGVTEATTTNVARLRRKLRVEGGLEISDEVMSGRNIRLRKLIRMPRNHRIGGIVEELERVDDSVTPRADVHATVIWAGTQPAERVLHALKHQYDQLAAPARNVSTEALGQRLFAAVVLDPNPTENNVRKKMALGDATAVHKALDQELLHASFTRELESLLRGVAAQVTVYRPPDALLIRRAQITDIQNGWRAYRTGSQPLLAGAIRPNNTTRVILVTVGHGAPIGATSFPSQGFVNQQQLARHCQLAAVDNTVLYVPLQCHPQIAVGAWVGLGGTASSINTDGKSDDHEMPLWYREHLIDVIEKWLDGATGNIH